MDRDGTIRIKIDDIAKDLGNDFVDKDPGTIYWGLKYVLFQEGIVVGMATHRSGEKMLTMRYANKSDILPPSLDDINNKSRTKNYLSVGDDFTGKTINSFFFDSEEYDVNSWREMLIRLIELIYSKHKRKFDKILEIEGSQGKRYFSRRRTLDDPIEIEGTGIYVEGKLSSNNIVRLCYTIINEFGYSDDDLKIEVK